VLTVDDVLTTDDEVDKLEEVDVATKVSIHAQSPRYQNLLEEVVTNVGEEVVLDDETTGATWYKFKTDLPPQYSFALSAQTILQGLAFATVLELTAPALRTLPQ
jgi:hypothetical protein